ANNLSPSALPICRGQLQPVMRRLLVEYLFGVRQLRIVKLNHPAAVPPRLDSHHPSFGARARQLHVTELRSECQFFIGRQVELVRGCSDTPRTLSESAVGPLLPGNLNPPIPALTGAPSEHTPASHLGSKVLADGFQRPVRGDEGAVGREVHES